MEDKRNTDETYAQVMKKLQQKEYDNELSYTGQGLMDADGSVYKSQELKILKAYHFGDHANVENVLSLYIIKMPDGKIGYSKEVYKEEFEQKGEYANFIVFVPLENKSESEIFGA